MARAAAAEKAPIENVATGFKNGLAWKKVKFRGETYHLTELPIGEYDEIARKATSTKTNSVGNEYEELDNQLQSRLMLKAALVSPKIADISSLGTRLTIALNRVVNELHYGEEEDQLRTEEAQNDESGSEEEEEGERPNG